jgi:hypothetical protein
MRIRVVALVLSCFPLSALPACKGQTAAPGPAPAPSAGSGAVASLAEREKPPRALNSAVVAFERTLQAQKLKPPARRVHEPQLAFGKGTFGQLTRDGFAVYDSGDFRVLTTQALESPRALVALADGSLLAIGARTMLRWERDKKRATALPRPMLLPGTQLYADAQQADLLWTFDGETRGGSAREPATLRSYRLKPAEAQLLLPEHSVELSSPRAGVFGVSREGVWLYATRGHVERYSPGGLRLPGFDCQDGPLPTWVVPARRLDQSLWLEEEGSASRVLLAAGCKRLSKVSLGALVDVDVGDEGRLVALVLVTGPGPRFELSLLDQDLAPLGRGTLPSDAPTGADDWVKVVTENQTVVVAPREPRVAVGGPSRVSIFDSHGAPLFSIPSR